MLNDQTLSDSILQHCKASMEHALLAERHPFLQTNEAIHGQLLPHSTYFKSLKPLRRTRVCLRHLNNAVSWVNWWVVGKARTPTNESIGFNYLFGQQRDNT